MVDGRVQWPSHLGPDEGHLSQMKDGELRKKRLARHMGQLRQR